MSSSINGTSALFGNSQMDQLIDRLIQLESGTKNRLESQKETQKQRKSAISDVGSKLSSLNTLLTNFQDPTSSQIYQLGASSSNPEAFGVSVDDTFETTGSFNIDVHQIAKNDTKVSKQFTAGDTTIRDNVDATNANLRTFNLKLPNNPRTDVKYTKEFTDTGTTISDNTTALDFNMSVGSDTFNISAGDVTGLSNEEALQKVADAINESAGNAASASVVKDESNNVRIVVEGKDSREGQRVSFSNSPDSGNIAEVLRFTYAGGPNEGEDKSGVFGDPDSTTQGGRQYDVSELSYTDFTISLAESDIAGKTNDEIIRSVAQAINDTAGSEVQASAVSESSGKVRLSVRSNETGENGLIEFNNQVPTDGNDTNIAEALRFTMAGGSNRGEDKGTIVDGTTEGGRIYEENELNAKFNIDGLSYEKTSNTVDDAMQGLTLELNKPTESTETFNVNPDTEAAKSEVQNFIDKYNSVVKTIRDKSFIDPNSGDRGALAGDREFRQLINRMRSSIIKNVDSSLLDNPDINNIFDIGLNFNQDGTLQIEDSAKLEEVLSDDPEAVSQLFNVSFENDPYSKDGNGLTKELEKSISSFVDPRKAGDQALVDVYKNSVDSEIQNLEDRISREEDRLETRRQILTEQFNRLQQISIEAQGQKQSLNAISGGSYNFQQQSSF